MIRRRHRRSSPQVVSVAQVENLEDRQMLDASGAISEAAGFDYFESRDQFAEHLVQQALNRWAGSFDQPTSWSGYPYVIDSSELVVTVRTASDFSTSETNTQVDGVDEADIIENDGRHLYLIQQGKLVIIDAANAEEMETVATLEVDGDPTAIFLHDDTLTVISQNWTTYDGSGDVIFPFLVTGGLGWSTEAETIVTSYDVSDPSDLSVVQQTKLEGNYLDARAIDGRVHVFTNQNVELPAPRTVPIDAESQSELEPEIARTIDASGLFAERLSIWQPPNQQYESRDSYEAWIREELDSLVDDIIPTYEMVGAGGVGTSGLISDFDEIATPTDGNSRSLVSVVTIDPHSEQPGLAGSTSVFAASYGARYATTEHLYLSSTQYGENGQETQILQFEWASDDSNIQLVGSGTVRGRLLDQFAMDEHNGHLRVATTSTGTSEDDFRTANNVFVLENVDGVLTEVGSIENFEENESIFAVRFEGDRGFIVTFERIDPLFMIDLSDPTNPNITGELEVPGFSTYLQRIDDDHLLAIGEIDGATKVSVYDISDAAAPALVDEDVLPEWSRSLAAYDHNAFGWYSQHSTLAIPVTNGSWRDGYRSELLTFNVDTSLEGENVVELIGSISDGDQQVLRSAFIGDVLYTITTDSVVATDITGEDQLGRVVGTSEHEAEVIQPLVPTFEIANNGTSEWIPGPEAARWVTPTQFFTNKESNELLVLVPESDEAIEIWIRGDTLVTDTVRFNPLIDFIQPSQRSHVLSADTRLVIKGTSGDNTFNIDFSEADEGLVSSLIVYGHAGNDVLNVNGLPADLEYAEVSGGLGNETVVVDTSVTNRVMLYGGKGDDTLTAGAGNDFVSGGPGNDMLYGNSGNDRLVGRAGEDRIWAHDGNDTIVGGAADDRLYGGRGNDLIRGGQGNDRLHGSNGADSLAGNSGDDWVLGNLGADTILDVLTSTINDRIAGGKGADQFVAGDLAYQDVIDRLFDFADNEDFISELWSLR